MNCSAGAYLWIAFAIILPLFMAALLVGPRAPAVKQSEYCVANLVSASPHFGVSINCDAFTLLKLAREPGRLLEPNNWRQSRPMMVMPAWALRPLFLWSVDAPKYLGIAPAPDMREYYRPYMPEFLAKDFPGFMAYALFNVLTLVAIFAVYLWLVLGNVSGRGWDAATIGTVGAIGGLLIANDVVKAFGWMPHAQLYNILAPLLAVAALARSVKSAPQAWVIGIGCGLGALAYPLFLLVAGCCFLRGLIDAGADASSRPIARAAIVVLLTIALSAGWVAFVLWYVGSFFSDTIHYRQVIWPIDSFAAGTLLGDLTEKFAYMMSRAGHQMSVLMLVFVPVVAAFWLKDRRPFMSDADFELCISALAVSVLVLIFNLIVGMNTSRTAYGMVAPLLVVCGILARIALDDARPQLVRWTVAACVAVTLSEFVHVAVKSGPYS